MEFSINKGIGKPAEFKGLKSQYLFIFAGGLLGLFIVFVVMYMAGIDQWMCIVFGVTAALTLVYGTFYLNNKYGEYGLMKAQSKRNHPRYVINRRNFFLLFQQSQIRNYEA
jgi:bacteriorhodopsin